MARLVLVVLFFLYSLVAHAVDESSAKTDQEKRKKALACVYLSLDGVEQKGLVLEQFRTCIQEGAVTLNDCIQQKRLAMATYKQENKTAKLAIDCIRKRKTKKNNRQQESRSSELPSPIGVKKQVELPF